MGNIQTTLWAIILAIAGATVVGLTARSAWKPGNPDIAASIVESTAGDGASTPAGSLDGNGTRPSLTNGLAMRLVWIPSGQFTMGSLRRPDPWDADEKPHRVRITRPFYLGACEVTVGQFRRFVEATGYRTEAERSTGPNPGINPTRGVGEMRPGFNWRKPGFAQSEDHPVVLVSWNDAVKFCQWLSAREQQDYRLPTEAEWEWACRAGTATHYSTGDEDWTLRGSANVRFLGDSHSRRGQRVRYTMPVGSLRPNAFGLYDMHGNVGEWCADWYAAQYGPEVDDPKGPATGECRVWRGGSFELKVWNARSANRTAYGPSLRDYSLGFRVAMSPR